MRKSIRGIISGLSVLALAATGLLVTSTSATAASTINLASGTLSGTTDYSVAGNTITVNGDVILQGTSTSWKVVVSGGTSASPRKITLAGAVLSSDDSNPAIKVNAGGFAEFNTTAASTLKGSAKQPGINIPVGATAKFTGTAALSVTGEGEAAAIGGDGNAVLTSNLKPVMFTGKAGANCGTFQLASGTLNATVNSGTGAAIGGGRFGDGCAVTISGGVLNATAASAAAIGGGIGEDAQNGYLKDSPGGAGGAVTISSGTVTAKTTGSLVDGTRRYSAAIGGGRGGGGGAEDQGTDGAGGTLRINGGSVKLDPASSNLAPTIYDAAGNYLVAATISSAAGVSAVSVTPAGGSAINYGVSANHHSDNALYIWVRRPATGTAVHQVSVTSTSGTKAYSVSVRATGIPTVVDADTATTPPVTTPPVTTPPVTTPPVTTPPVTTPPTSNPPVATPNVVQVKVAQAQVILVKGKSAKIPALAYLSDGKLGKITWKSSKAAVATVNATGTIVAKAAGSAVITATSGNQKTTVKVTVLAKATKASKAKVKTVSASVPKTLAVGKSAYVTGKYAPASVAGVKVTYSSSKSAIAAVDAAGRILAKKAGKTVISVNAGGKSKKFELTVK